ncbi:MAG: hypothetical protein C0609_06875 [Deltaproteobacteria bacterium]|nr:MAG: hypothetical protein C0609_06875 [Deltaproteobacteria bacterium]
MRRITLVSFFLVLALFFMGTTGHSAGDDMIGMDAPLFVSPNLDDTDLDLSTVIGKKVILLDFWSIYCVSCVQEMPHLAKIQEKFPDDLLNIGVDLDSFGTKRVKKFVEKKFPNLPYPIIIDKRRKVAGLYSVSVLPTTIIIDKAGKIIFYHVGYKPGDEKEIEEVIANAIGK